MRPGLCNPDAPAGMSVGGVITRVADPHLSAQLLGSMAGIAPHSFCRVTCVEWPESLCERRALAVIGTGRGRHGDTDGDGNQKQGEDERNRTGKPIDCLAHTKSREGRQCSDDTNHDNAHV